MKNKYLIGIVIYLPMVLQFTTLLKYPLAPIVRIIQLISALILMIRNLKIKTRYTKNKFIILIFFILLFVVSMFTSYKSDISLVVMKRVFTILFPNLLLIYMVFTDDSPKDTFNFFMKIQMKSGVLFSIYGILLSIFGEWEYFKLHEIPIQSLKIGKIKFIQRVHGSTIPYRISSFLNNPNSLGILLVLTILSTVYLFKINKINKYSFISCSLIQFVGIILTQSRTAFITLLIALFLFEFILYDKKIRFLLILMVALPLVIMILQTNHFGLNISIINRFKNISLSGREHMWKLLYSSFLSNYLMGVGFSTSYESLLIELDLVSHNIYLRVLAEMGLIGFLTFIMFWISGIILSMQQVIKNTWNENKYIYVYIVSILIALLFHQLAEEQLLRYNYIMFLWVYLISLSAVNLSEKID